MPVGIDAPARLLSLTHDTALRHPVEVMTPPPEVASIETEQPAFHPSMRVSESASPSQAHAPLQLPRPDSPRRDAFCHGGKINLAACLGASALCLTPHVGLIIMHQVACAQTPMYCVFVSISSAVCPGFGVYLGARSYDPPPAP